MSRREISREQALNRSGRLAYLPSVFAITLTLLVASSSGSQVLPFRCWSIADGLAQSVVNTLLEDSRGFLWIGTASGLSRFDGTVFINYDVEHGLPSARIYSLLEDRDGVLWAGTDRGMARFDGERWQALFTDSPLGRARVVAMAEDVSQPHSPRRFFGTSRSGLFVIDGSNAPEHIAGTNSVTSLLSLNDDLWVGTREGLRLLVGDRLEPLASTAPFAASPVQALSLDPPNRLLVAGEAGGFLFDPSVPEWQQISDAEAGRLMAIAPGHRGRKWLGTHHRGLLRVDGPRSDRLGSTNGLANESIRALMTHSEGGLWIGTYGGGVCRLNDESFALFTQDHGLPSERVLGLAEGPDGEIWVGMLEGGVGRFDGQSFEVFGRDQGLESLAVSHVAVDADGTVWVGTLRGGLHRFRPDIKIKGKAGAFESIELSTPQPLSIFHIMVDDENSLWISAWEMGLIHLDPRSLQTEVLGVTEGLMSGRIFSTSQAPDGQIWISTAEGVQVLEPETSTFSGFTEEQDPPGRVRAAVHDSTGQTFLATDRGVARWNGQRFSYLGRQQGLASNTLYLLTLDSRSRLWLGSERGLDRLTLDKRGRLSEPRHFGATEGFVGVETNQNAVLEDRRGRLWFGTRGLARFDPVEEPETRPLPRLYFAGIRLFDGTPVAFTRRTELELPWHQADLIFDLIGLDFARPEAVRYRYRLLGHSDEWSPPSANRNAVFPGLAPGHYTFEAAATSHDAWTDPVRLAFAVRPPFWATWWFRGAVTAALGLLLALFASHRVRDSRRRRLELETAVAERTHDLVQAKQEAETANEAKTEFLSNMSHELRTPLTGVVSAAELLAKTSLDSKQGGLVSTIETSGRVLLSVINDILDQSRIKALGLQIDTRDFSPTACFEECMSVVRYSAESKGLKLYSKVDDTVPERAIGDPVRLRQVILNLLGNSIKFTEQGHVSASMTADEEQGDRVRLRLEISDTGIGMSPEVRQRIFEPFQQADMSSSRAYGGTGLGLSICERLVTMMGGSIEVESEVGLGSIFRFDVEVELPSAHELVTNIEDELPEIRTDLRVLLVEDNPLSQLITGSQLESLGLAPDIAANGQAAVDRVAESEYDVVFMDGQMPGLDGYAATQKIRQTEAGDRVIIIGLTAHATSEARNHCLAAGMNDYLAKPVQVRELAERLAEWFPRITGA